MIFGGIVFEVVLKQLVDAEGQRDTGHILRAVEHAHIAIQHRQPAVGLKTGVIPAGISAQL